jgi:hypothetical protein
MGVTSGAGIIYPSGAPEFPFPRIFKRVLTFFLKIKQTIHHADKTTTVGRKKNLNI